MITLKLGDCLHILSQLPDNSVDSIVTDPPYGLSFMGKAWDYDVPGQNIWEECWRVLKPGGHLLAFSGTRTYHRMVVKIEDAGFEIRDMIQWIYGSGFPKSTDVSKRIDKEAGAERENDFKSTTVRESANSSSHRGTHTCNNCGKFYGSASANCQCPKSKPSTPEAIQWQGWGTALKPANEPIVVARKPIEKGLTVAQNVLKWGTGALNIDGSRIGSGDRRMCGTTDKSGISSIVLGAREETRTDQGRWPANVLLDEEAAKVLDEQSKDGRAGKPSGSFSRRVKRGVMPTQNHGEHEGELERCTPFETGPVSGASRFFYVAKASKSERNAGLEGMPLVTVKISGQGAACPKQTKDGKPNKDIQNQNFHPTVKPIKLMSYLINLVTPPGGTVLDCFLGSGTTGVAAKLGGFSFIGIEREPEYLAIAQKRIENAGPEVKEPDPQLEFPA